MKKILFLFIFLLNSSLILYSQSYRFYHYTVNQGLSQSVIHSIYQDTRGFIWVGTQDGLNRFDGYSFIKFLHNPNDTNSLSDNWVYNITEDSDGNLWIGTRQGLCRFNYDRNSFSRYTHGVEYQNDPYRDNVYGCVISTEGKIFTNTPPLINLFDSKTGKFTHYMNSIGNNDKIEDQSLPIIFDRDGLIWAATSAGLVVFDPNREKFTNFQHNPSDRNSLSNNSIQGIFEDHEGLIWVGTPNGIDIYDKSRKTFSRYPLVLNGTPVSVRSIVQDRKGYFWIGTQGHGLLKIIFEKGVLKIDKNISEGQTLSPSFLNNSFVNALLIDRSQNLWIGTLNGLDKTDLKDPLFKLYRRSAEASSIDLLDNVIASIYKDKEGNIWVGNWGKGLNIIDAKTKNVKHYSSALQGKNHLVNDFVHVIFEYSENEIWIGTRNGIFVFTNNQFVDLNLYYKSKQIPTFSNNRVLCILKDTLDNVWIGTQGGLYYLDLINNNYRCFTSSGNHRNRISDNLVYSLVFDNNKDLWIATKNGLDRYSYRNDRIVNYTRVENSTNTLSDNYIVSLCFASDHNLWIGTKSSGINRLNLKDSIFTYFTEADGLASNIIYEIVEDDFGNMWFSSGKGLSLLKKGESRIRTYTEEDGLQGIEFNLRASYKSKDGEIFFGGMTGFNSFDPKDISQNKYIPSMEFTSFQKLNKDGTHNIHITNKRKIVLEYGDFAFNVEFSALEYTSSNKNQYAYKFDGTSSSWIDIGNRRFLTFSTLAPGQYQLWIKGSNNDGVWNNEGTYISLKILPPWWRSRIAYVIYFILIVSLIFTFIKYRERTLREQKKILEKKVKERTEEVEKQKSEILDKNNELEQQNHEILAQRDTLSKQNERISKQNKQIKDSIQYASRIQSAILPATSVFSNYNFDHFLVYRPKDIVSGDFYWIRQVDNHLLFAIADCTGHGVPGAFMSMLGNSFLNEIVNYNEVTKASQVLEQLRDLVISSLGQSGDDSVTRDGMDISFCEIDLDTLEMQFAGAYNSLVVIRDGEILDIKADRFPVGHYYKGLQPFTNNHFNLKKGDLLYLFTDGITDQFGGHWGGKYSIRKLKSFLHQVHHLPMITQREKIEEDLDAWMGRRYDQIDDITLLGLKIN